VWSGKFRYRYLGNSNRHRLVLSVIIRHADSRLRVYQEKIGDCFRAAHPGQRVQTAVTNYFLDGLIDGDEIEPKYRFVMRDAVPQLPDCIGNGVNSDAKLLDGHRRRRIWKFDFKVEFPQSRFVTKCKHRNPEREF